MILEHRMELLQLITPPAMKLVKLMRLIHPTLLLTPPQTKLMQLLQLMKLRPQTQQILKLLVNLILQMMLLETQHQIKQI